MTLQAFSFPFPDTRFIKAGDFIYKFKIRGSGYSGEEFMRGKCFNQELEEIIRTVLSNLDNLQPFSSAHFNVFPYKKHWKGVSKDLCRCCQGNLQVYAFIIVLYLEENRQNGRQAEEKLSPEKEVAQQIPSVSEPQSKRHKKDSPLEGAIIKDFIKDSEAESNISVVRLHLNNPHAEDEVKGAPGHADKEKTKGFDKPQQKSGVNKVGVGETPGEVHPGTNQDTGEEEGDEDGENADTAPETPVEPGMWTRLASHIFPFSLFVRNRAVAD